MFDFGWIDAHCHLTDNRILNNIEDEFSEADKAGITGFLSSVLSAEEFEMIELPEFRKFGKIIKWAAGIHPFYENSSENDFDQLVELCEEKRIIAVGEIGLDKRNDNFEYQRSILLKQLDLAKNYDLPVIFHCVRNHYELIKIIKDNFPKVHGIIHSFNSSKEVFAEYSRFDLGISLNFHLPKPEVVKEIISRGFFYFETDAPYQKKDSKAEYNHLSNLLKIIRIIAEISGMEMNELKKKQYENFRNLFGESNGLEF